MRRKKAEYKGKLRGESDVTNLVTKKEKKSQEEGKLGKTRRVILANRITRKMRGKEKRVGTEGKLRERDYSQQQKSWCIKSVSSRSDLLSEKKKKKSKYTFSPGRDVEARYQASRVQAMYFYTVGWSELQVHYVRSCFPWNDERFLLRATLPKTFSTTAVIFYRGHRYGN